MPDLIIIRGLPGSGKSTYARSMGRFHVEADMYHTRGGKYTFDAKNVQKAHAWCFAMFSNAVSSGIDIVVSNTFTRRWEFREYVSLAKENGYNVAVVRMTANYGSIHDVPDSVLAEMKDRFEDYDCEMLITDNAL